MLDLSRKKIHEYYTAVAQANGGTDGRQQFNLLPSTEQTLRDKLAESTDFLGKVNMAGVRDLKGQALVLGVSGPFASRTDEAAKARETTDISSLSGSDYECAKTDHDTHVKYATVDMWAKFADFNARISTQKVKAIARDTLMIGWHGTSIAATTDKTNNPLLQDVNKGWLQILRDQAPAHVDATGVKVSLSDDVADYRTLDALICDMPDVLPDWYKDDTSLVAIVGRKLLQERKQALQVSAGAKPTEQAVLADVLARDGTATHKIIPVPFFPANAILLINPANLSIYTQDGSTRRYYQDNPSRSRVEDYMSSNVAYVIEDMDGAVLFENLKTSDDE